MPLVCRKWRAKSQRPALLCLGLAVALLAAGCHRKRPRPAIQPPPPAPSAPTPSAPAPRPRGGRAAAPPAPIVQGEEGIASWYGHPFHGRPTASGEIYSMYAMTAAHRTLPFGTQVRVHDLENSKSVDVRINDRGPFVEGRIIDLSYAAAQAMGMSGTALVRLEILGYGTIAAASASSGARSSGGAGTTSSTGTGPAPLGGAGTASSGGARTGPSSGTSAAPPPGVFAVQVGAFQDRRNAERLKAQISATYNP
ncbi:MAG TPA: septal ring lytic transglycosylase RlpA family protein, partial [Terriglobia bacterium]|nr:septal ring lytic transglycosylase RlpA family protein [Terriglobia bacterium]